MRKLLYDTVCRYRPKSSVLLYLYTVSSPQVNVPFLTSTCSTFQPGGAIAGTVRSQSGTHWSQTLSQGSKVRIWFIQRLQWIHKPDLLSAPLEHKNFNYNLFCCELLWHYNCHHNNLLTIFVAYVISVVHRLMSYILCTSPIATKSTSWIALLSTDNRKSIDVYICLQFTRSRDYESVYIVHQDANTLQLLQWDSSHTRLWGHRIPVGLYNL